MPIMSHPPSSLNSDRSNIFSKNSTFKETVELKFGSITLKNIMASSLLDAGGGVFSLAVGNRPTIYSFLER
jgi:hypothetical protein